MRLHCLKHAIVQKQTCAWRLTESVAGAEALGLRDRLLDSLQVTLEIHRPLVQATRGLWEGREEWGRGGRKAGRRPLGRGRVRRGDEWAREKGEDGEERPMIPPRQEVASPCEERERVARVWNEQAPRGSAIGQFLRLISRSGRHWQRRGGGEGGGGRCFARLGPRQNRGLARVLTTVTSLIFVNGGEVVRSERKRKWEMNFCSSSQTGSGGAQKILC